MCQARRAPSALARGGRSRRGRALARYAPRAAPGAGRRAGGGIRGDVRRLHNRDGYGREGEVMVSTAVEGTGENLQSLVAELSARDRWTDEQVRRYRSERLGELIEHAGSQSP